MMTEDKTEGFMANANTAAKMIEDLRILSGEMAVASENLMECMITLGKAIKKQKEEG